MSELLWVVGILVVWLMLAGLAVRLFTGRTHRTDEGDQLALEHYRREQYLAVGLAPDGAPDWAYRRALGERLDRRVRSSTW